jgi:hypothetical protein
VFVLQLLQWQADLDERKYGGGGGRKRRKHRHHNIIRVAAGISNNYHAIGVDF